MKQMIGILGGGQLGWMLALAGYPLGVELRSLDPAAEASIDTLVQRVHGDYDDEVALAAFATGLDCITYEFENVPVATARFLERTVPVSPPPAALEVAQDRLVEKTFLREHGIPTPTFAAVMTRADLDEAAERIGLPAVLKTRRLGYDGKGQHVLRSIGDLDAGWDDLGGVPLILESFVPFDRELSIIAARGRDGSAVYYPLVQNTHRDGILRLSLAPAATAGLQDIAQEYIGRVLTALDYVGVLAIELFELDGELLANEMAPRVHNSGHWTIEGAETSQFANHMRAIMGLPLGSTAPRGYSAMLNCIGTMPDPAAVLALPGAHLHDYGKTPRAGRKLGHVTLRADTVDELQTQLARALPLVDPDFAR